jgi:hypothetical protein
MGLRRRPKSTDAPPVAGYVGDHADKLSRARPIAHDEDERPCREDRDFGSTIFTGSPVPLPRFLTGRKRRPPS